MVDVVTARYIDADPAAVFALLADYWRRPALLPASFTDYGIKRGGYGAGTRLRYRLHMAGRARDCHIEVTEPVKGRQLLESDTATSLCTRWSIEALQARRCRVHVEATWPERGGLTGWVERTVAARMLDRAHTTILDRLARQPELHHD